MLSVAELDLMQQQPRRSRRAVYRLAGIEDQHAEAQTAGEDIERVDVLLGQEDALQLRPCGRYRVVASEGKRRDHRHIWTTIFENLRVGGIDGRLGVGRIAGPGLLEGR